MQISNVKLNVTGFSVSNTVKASSMEGTPGKHPGRDGQADAGHGCLLNTYYVLNFLHGRKPKGRMQAPWSCHPSGGD